MTAATLSTPHPPQAMAELEDLIVDDGLLILAVPVGQRHIPTALPYTSTLPPSAP